MTSRQHHFLLKRNQTALLQFAEEQEMESWSPGGSGCLQEVDMSETVQLSKNLADFLDPAWRGESLSYHSNQTAAVGVCVREVV